MRDIVIFDLDGTIALIEHRRHFVENGKKQWPEFFAACIDDAPNHCVIEIARAMRDAKYEIWIVSGRSNEVEAETRQWLDDFCVPHHKVLMREHGDHQPDDNLKAGWIKSGAIPIERVLCVLDDRDRVVNMWRTAGLPCFQVAPGAF